MVRLGAVLPFAQAATLLAHFTGVTIDPETIRRLTEAAGAVQVVLETEAVTHIERTLPAPPAGPAVQLLSVDGAYVPLLHGEWAEVKTLALGTVSHHPDGTIQTSDLSYCSHLATVDTFARLVTVETHRRGTETAGTVVAVTDGSQWCQSVIDLQRSDAVRILDFPHAVEHLSHVAQVWFGTGTGATSEWLGQQVHALRHGDEAQVIADLAALATDREGSAEARDAARRCHGYLDARREQIRYQHVVEHGYPIGSGCVESANKLVVEARLKGSGMHWARANVNPMLALRTVWCNGRWEHTWPDLWERLCVQARERARVRVRVRVRVLERRARQQAAREPEPIAAPATRPVPPDDPAPAPVPRRKTIVNGKPTVEHPWRRSSPVAAKR
jgi:hypothetical protein